MNGGLKVEFVDDDYFTIYYITNDRYETEDEYRILFQYFNTELTKRYNYSLEGLYEVTIYVNKGVYILVFERLDYYERRDFDVTILLNSLMLYQFEDIDLVPDDKVYYEGYFYTEIDNVVGDIRLFEYGNIIYGKKADEVLSRGLLLTESLSQVFPQ